MKNYLVHAYDLTIVPLNGQETRGARTDYFEDFAVAESFAVAEKDKWDMVTVSNRTTDGKLQEIFQFRKGRRFESSYRVE